MNSLFVGIILLLFGIFWSWFGVAVRKRRRALLDLFPVLGPSSCPVIAKSDLQRERISLDCLSVFFFSLVDVLK